MIDVTTAARIELSNILARQVAGSPMVRVSAIRGPHGCIHGWQLGIEHEPRDSDVTVTNGDLDIVVDPAVAPALKGAMIDYREDARGLGFVISQPDVEVADHQGAGDGGCQHA